MRIAMFSAEFILVASPITAQGPTAVGLRQPAIALARTIGLQSDSIPRTHWVRGAEIGAGVGLAFDLFVDMMRRGLCDSSDCREFHPMYFLAPMGFFAFIGSMIGSGFRKDH